MSTGRVEGTLDYEYASRKQQETSYKYDISEKKLWMSWI